jgi:hypothetical protein
MWRKIFLIMGEFIKGDFFKKALLAVFSAYSGLTVIVNVYVGAVDSPKSPFEIAIDSGILSFWLFSFLIFVYLFFGGLGTFLVWSSNYYPTWFYFPRTEMIPKITCQNEIEVAIVNLRMQRMDLGAVYAILSSDVKQLPSQANGVSPHHNRLLMPLASMTGRDARIMRIGRIDNGSLILSAGEGNDEMKLEKPGTYLYWINLFGEFRHRDFSGGGKIAFRITENKEVKLDD